MFGPRLVDVNAELSADAASGAGSFCDSHLLERKNSLVDLGQLLAKMGNQCVKGDLVRHDATPSEKHVIIMVWGTTPRTPYCTLPSNARKVDTVKPATGIGPYPTLRRVRHFGRNWKSEIAISSFP